MSSQHSTQEVRVHAEWLLSDQNPYGVSADEEILCQMALGLVEQFEALREAARPFAEPDDTTLEQYEVLRAVLYPSSEPGLGHSAIADHRLPGSEVSSPASEPKEGA